MNRYINFNANSLPPLNTESNSIFSRVMSAGSNMSTNTMLLIGGVLLFAIIAIFYYFYYIAPSMKPKYHPNSEQIPLDGSSAKNAELLFFYADWCPHCKAANKVVFTEVDCSEETSEVEKLMNQYSIEGYPTIKLVKDGQVVEYDAKPSHETLSKFLNTVL